MLYEGTQGIDSCLISLAINKTSFLGDSLIQRALSILQRLSKRPYNASVLERME